MICKFLFFVTYTVDSPQLGFYSVGVYVQAENEEHATIRVQDYLHTHSLTGSILNVQPLQHFLIATEDHYPKSNLLQHESGIFQEVDDLP